METKGSTLCDTLYDQWGNRPDETGATPFAGMSHLERTFGKQVWRNAWTVAIAQAAHSQEDRSSHRHGYDKHGDAQALLRALSLDPCPEELEY